MKYIIKRLEPQSFTDWKSGEDREYKDLINPIKGDVKESLLVEQGYICCYCESKISKENSHIEHIKPKDKNKFPELQLDYDNMLCSCQKQLSKGEPRHCGNSKANDIIIITPLDIDCESKFKYNENGTIEATDEDSEETIKYLKLDIDKLNELRKNAIEPFIIDPITFEAVSIEDVKIFVQKYLEQNNGKYNEFYTTIEYLFSKIK
jgi:uncharacterized protein (TIGR02646 family)